MSTVFRLQCGAVTLSVALSVAMLVSGCHDDAVNNTAAPPKAPADPNLVIVSPDLLSRLKLGTVGTDNVRETLRVAGQVKVDEEHVARIGAPVTGRITEIQAEPGDRVRAGDLLATINSTELGNAQLAYLKAQSQTQLASRSVERAHVLFNADVIGAAELQRRESEATEADAEMRAAADQLRVLGMSRAAIDKLTESRAINSVASITATIAGTVIERKVTPGQVVQPADALFTIANLADVWVIAEVPEQQAHFVKTGETVHIEIPALDNRDIVGRLIYVADVVNPETRTVTVRTEVKNPDRAIKPAMLATMVVQGAPMRSLAVPTSAVVREGNRETVFVQTGADRFLLRDVKLGPEYGGVRTVLEGLQAGDVIVVEGGFHLNNERKQKALGS